MVVSYYTEHYSAAELESLFTRKFGARLTFVGFQPISPRNWVRDTGHGFKQFFFLHAIARGYQYLPGGAISLDFVPRVKAGKVKLQPKPKHAEVHLAFSRQRNDWFLDHRRENSEEKMDLIAQQAVPAIVDWLESFRSFEDIRQGFVAERAKDRGGLVYPVFSRAYAFLLARMKRGEEAQKEFQRAMRESSVDPEVATELTQHFERELAGQ